MNETIIQLPDEEVEQDNSVVIDFLDFAFMKSDKLFTFRIIIDNPKDLWGD